MVISSGNALSVFYIRLLIEIRERKVKEKNLEKRRRRRERKVERKEKRRRRTKILLLTGKFWT